MLVFLQLFSPTHIVYVLCKYFWNTLSTASAVATGAFRYLAWIGQLQQFIVCLVESHWFVEASAVPIKYFQPNDMSSF